MTERNLVLIKENCSHCLFVSLFRQNGYKEEKTKYNLKLGNEKVFWNKVIAFGNDKRDFKAILSRNWN